MWRSLNCFGSGDGEVPVSPVHVAVEPTRSAAPCVSADFLACVKHGWRPLQWEVEVTVEIAPLPEEQWPHDVCGHLLTDNVMDVIEANGSASFPFTVLVPGEAQGGGDYSGFVPEDWGGATFGPSGGLVGTIGSTAAVRNVTALVEGSVYLGRFRDEYAGAYFAPCRLELSVVLQTEDALGVPTALERWGTDPGEDGVCGLNPETGLNDDGVIQVTDYAGETAEGGSAVVGDNWFSLELTDGASTYQEVAIYRNGAGQYWQVTVTALATWNATQDFPAA